MNMSHARTCKLTCIFVLKIGFIFKQQTVLINTDEMHSSAFHRSLHCLPKKTIQEVSKIK